MSRGFYNKYVLVKRSELGKLSPAVQEKLERVEVKREFFAILEGDVFGPSGLFAYAGNIRTALEFMGPSRLDEAARANLEALADDLVVVASRWQNELNISKIPD